MIDVEEVLAFHEKLIEQFGGTSGIRSRDLLEFAVFRSYLTFDGQELYPTAIEKAAAILKSIVKNHPFLDGNKRTGYVLMRLMLMNSRMDIIATEEEKYKFIIQIASGELDFDEIKAWIGSKIKEK